MASVSEQACCLAVLILADSGKEVNADNITKIVKKAGIQIESWWPNLLAKSLEQMELSALIDAVSSSVGGGAPAAAGPAAPAGGDAPAAAAKEEKKEESEDESEDDMGFGLFD